MGLWIFILLFRLYNLVLLLDFVATVLALAAGSSFSWLLCLFAVSPSVCALVVSISLLSGTTKWSRLLLCISCLLLESAISQRALIPFTGDSIWNPVWSLLLGCSFFLALSADRVKKYVCYINPCLYVYLEIFLYVAICICIKLNVTAYPCLWLYSITMDCFDTYPLLSCTFPP